MNSKVVRFALVTLAFLLFEAAMILVFGELLNDARGSDVAYWLVPAVAAVGYFGLGAGSGSWWSLFVVAIPVLLAGPLDLHYVDDGRGEIWPLQSIWMLYSVFFLAAWGLGLLLGSLIDNRPDLETNGKT